MDDKERALFEAWYRDNVFDKPRSFNAFGFARDASDFYKVDDIRLMATAWQAARAPLLARIEEAEKTAGRTIELGNVLVEGGSVEYTLMPGCRCGMCHGFKINTDEGKEYFGETLAEAIDAQRKELKP